MHYIYSGAIAFLTGIACGAVAYAAREGAETVAFLVVILATVGGGLAAMRDVEQ